MNAPPRPPLAHALGLVFAIAPFAGIVLGAAWLASGLTRVQPGTRAVVMRWGAPVAQHGPGLLFAWPRPIDRVVVVPAADRPLRLALGSAEEAGPDEPLLTGDAGLVRLSGAVVYHVSDPIDYAVMATRVETALRRAFVAAAVDACASRRLDETVAVAGAAGGADTSDDALTRERRERFRADAAHAAEARVDALGLGIAVDRVDLTIALPPRIQSAFEQVVAAESEAARQAAVARTDAARRRQDALADRQRLLAEADSQARDEIAKARVAVAPMLALTAEPDPDRRAAARARSYREKVAPVVSRSSVTVVDGDRAALLMAAP